MCACVCVCVHGGYNHYLYLVAWMSTGGVTFCTHKPRLHKLLTRVGIRGWGWVKLNWVGVDTPNPDSNLGQPR